MQNGRKQAGRLFFAKRRQKEAGMERDVLRLTEQFAFSDRVGGLRIPFAEEIHAKIERMRRLENVVSIGERSHTVKYLSMISAA